jgi:hypothetical protein
MSLTGFPTFHIGRDLLSNGTINLTSALPANRRLSIDRSTVAGSQINIATSAGLLGQIDINRGNTTGTWGGTVTVGSTSLTVPGYTNTAASLGGGAAGLVPFGLHDESCAPVNGGHAIATGGNAPVVRLRHYGPLTWTTGLPVTIKSRAACSTDPFAAVNPSPTSQDFALDDDNPNGSDPMRTLVVSTTSSPVRNTRSNRRRISSAKARRATRP